MNVNLAQIEDQYARLRARLGRLGWISHGYVQDRGPGAGGPCYHVIAVHRRVRQRRRRREVHRTPSHEQDH